MLSSPQRAAFALHGLLRLPAALPDPDVAAMRDRFWSFLTAEHGLRPDDPVTWTVEHPRHLQALRRSGAFAPLGGAQVVGALDDLLGVWRRPTSWGLPLVTFPRTGRWRLPATGWHVDSYGPEHDLPGVTVFAFLLPVAAAGGGTAVLAGSHHLVNRHIATTGTWRPAEVKAALTAAHPWLRETWRGNREPGDEAVLDGISVEVRELTGNPGDVVLMHPRTLHAPSPNTGPTPRMMLVEIISRLSAGRPEASVV
ncbi:phytanoyl-CoA dioxygenase family protein [Asanoa sp. WMMD1127]|uniref:phytanoyl-CoA dioxygenase family protein n=1 Tax=Asanoa sp. WMMD1127 TaxID=3016107 RepID=UPI002415C0E2|nr:phytanoyl-CoA dioxygenase family protein [Asanoa sp. WMMD1127]MDG4825653.1 phytanoyl-CoA dioxygenase family protein [Asanoa sp. WMMD1127]